MRTSRNDSPSNRRRRPSSSPIPAARMQSFSCSADLLRAFEHRAFQLGCSFDWLLEEAMQRLLADGGEPARDEATNEPANDDSRPAPPESVHQMKPWAALPSPPRPQGLLLPLPPDALPSTLPPPPARAQHQAPRLSFPRRPSGSAPASVPAPVSVSAPPRLERARAATAREEPLVLHSGNEQLVIDRHPFVIGRSAILADLVINDGEVSRRHAVIEHTAEGWVITDVGSTNGIIVNGEVVRHAVLRSGVVMSIGPMAFSVGSVAR